MNFTSSIITVSNSLEILNILIIQGLKAVITAVIPVICMPFGGNSD